MCLSSRIGCGASEAGENEGSQRSAPPADQGSLAQRGVDAKPKNSPRGVCRDEGVRRMDIGYRISYIGTYERGQVEARLVNARINVW